MRERILALAVAASGGGADLLEPLCAAAEDLWRGRLREGVAPEDCGEALICAAAFTAAANLAAGDGAGGGIASFSAGDVSVKLQDGAGRTETAKSLLQAAERLMEPFVRVEGLWAKGVRG